MPDSFIQRKLKKLDENLYFRLKLIWKNSKPFQEAQVVIGEQQDDGSSHCKRVEKNIGRLLDKYFRNYISDAKRLFLLSCCACLHDVGKAHGKKGHGHNAAAIMNMMDLYLKPHEKISIIKAFEIHDLNGEEFSQKFNDLNNNAFPDSYNPQFLASLLKAADTLDMTQERVLKLKNKSKMHKVCFRGIIFEGVEFNDGTINLFLMPDTCHSTRNMYENINYIKNSEWPPIARALRVFMGGSFDLELSFKINFSSMLELKSQNRIRCDAIPCEEHCSECVPISYITSILKKKNINYNDHFTRHNNLVQRTSFLEEFSNWASNLNAPKIMWITGGPGTGKSALSTMLCKKDPRIIAYHFCSIYENESRDIVSYIKSLVSQLSNNLPGYKECLPLRSFKDIWEGTINPQVMFDKLIKDPIKNLPNIDNQIKIILVDGSDEACIGGTNEFPGFIARNFKEFPPLFRLIITSRPNINVKTVLGVTFNNNDLLRINLEDYRQDITKYLYKGLNNIRFCNATKKQIVTELARKTGTTFLYARLIVFELNKTYDKRKKPLSIEDLNIFPDELSEYYLRYFERRFLVNPHQWESDVLPILEVFCAARQPIDINSLSEIAGLENFDGNIFEELLGSLFTISKKDNLTPFHSTVTEWLLSDDNSSRFHINILKGHEKFSSYGWKLYKNKKIQEEEYSYFAEYLPFHLIKSTGQKEATYYKIRMKRVDELLSDNEFLDLPGDPRYNRWSRNEKQEWTEVYAQYADYLLGGEDDLASLIKSVTIYFDAFWWWGEYIDFKLCQLIIKNFQKHADNKELFQFVLSFNKSYPKRRFYEGRGEKRSVWKEVESSLNSIKNLLQLEIPIKDNPSNKKRRRLLAIINIYLAEAYDYLCEDQQSIELYEKSMDELRKNKNDEWSIIFIYSYLADYWRRRGNCEKMISFCEKVLLNEKNVLETDPDAIEAVADMYRILGEWFWIEKNYELWLISFQISIAYTFMIHAHTHRPADLYTVNDFQEHLERFLKPCVPLFLKEKEIAESLCQTIVDFWKPLYSSKHPDINCMKSISNNNEMEMFLRNLLPPEPICGSQDDLKYITSKRKKMNDQIDKFNCELPIKTK